MKVYPASAPVQLEFDKVKELLLGYCRSEYAKEKARDLPTLIRLEEIQWALRQAYEYKTLLSSGLYFPHDEPLNLARELQMIAIPGAVLSGEEFLHIRKLGTSMDTLFHWFNEEKKQAWPGLYMALSHSHYEKNIISLIDEVIDELGQVKDNASEDLKNIRQSLSRRRNELRRLFEKVVARLNKQGYLAEIEESFMNGRKVVAIFAEQKRTVKGIMHGESDSRKTAFIEPEETIELNIQVTALENEERREVYRILRQLISRLSEYADLLKEWQQISGEYDLIRAKALFAIDVNGEFPMVSDKSFIHLVNAYHPLLFLYNRRQNKPTIPVTVSLNEKQRILIISGPNAGGKTVTMKTVGLLQKMVQSGLLVPVHASSEFGIFKQLMIHIGDTQSIEFELSTYSSHLLHMKYFMENANGRTLFFIDELGSGSDPNLGGAFAEVILQELVKKHAIGIVTTHYLNLKLMAGKTTGILNGAMGFDEKNLQPQYKLLLGKPGSSYTFSIAERIGLKKELIDKARELVDADQFRLDKLLNRTEQDLQEIDVRNAELQKLLKENEKLKKDLQHTLEKEKHLQQVELLKEQNRVAEEKFNYLRDMERKLKQLLIDWKRAEGENKNKLVKQMEAMLFKKDEKKVVSKMQKKIDSKFNEVGGEVRIGDTVKMKKNHQVGKVIELRAKKAIVQIGMLPMQVELKDLVVVREKPSEEA